MSWIRSVVVTTSSLPFLALFVYLLLPGLDLAAHGGSGGVLAVETDNAPVEPTALPALTSAQPAASPATVAPAQPGGEAKQESESVVNNGKAFYEFFHQGQANDALKCVKLLDGKKRQEAARRFCREFRRNKILQTACERQSAELLRAVEVAAEGLGPQPFPELFEKMNAVLEHPYFPEGKSEPDLEAVTTFITSTVKDTWALPYEELRALPTNSCSFTQGARLLMAESTKMKAKVKTPVETEAVKLEGITDEEVSAIQMQVEVTIVEVALIAISGKQKLVKLVLAMAKSKTMAKFMSLLVSKLRKWLYSFEKESLEFAASHGEILPMILALENANSAWLGGTGRCARANKGLENLMVTLARRLAKDLKPKRGSSFLEMYEVQPSTGNELASAQMTSLVSPHGDTIELPAKRLGVMSLVQMSQYPAPGSARGRGWMERRASHYVMAFIGLALTSTIIGTALVPLISPLFVVFLVMGVTGFVIFATFTTLLVQRALLVRAVEQAVEEIDTAQRNIERHLHDIRSQDQGGSTDTAGGNRGVGGSQGSNYPSDPRPPTPPEMGLPPTPFAPPLPPRSVNGNDNLAYDGSGSEGEPEYDSVYEFDDESVLGRRD
ncbi:conserved hypothetical protein [Neospora caninum Liverpool]|uniref:Transmembrane protein n=1 Tax=Neospora caninum (strain Liverpool) TaxID=572307 RepID=F0VPZ5_NEOCL|nr:conserved hypothetical protein [Neospora caninum Liverpool]CBZ55792.1 conserved hypothetical protein [Neospora caninum Liverpool]|eukprot:XP_003885818.1 conserved hypothetical protein [Neospora caninum Liverpool]